MVPPQARDYIGLSPAAAALATELRLGLPGTEEADLEGSGVAEPLTLELLPKGGAKRGFAEAVVGDPAGQRRGAAVDEEEEEKKKKAQAPAAKAQVVGWPPIRSYRKNTMALNQPALKGKDSDEAKQATASGCLYVKVSMDGAPYLRKVDLKIYKNYKELSLALEKMFSCFTVGHSESNGKLGRDNGLSDCRLIDLKNGIELVLTYEDKDGDWMLVGDVPWRMFTDSCKRLRIMKGPDAVGLGKYRYCSGTILSSTGN
ncbi:hypothetical protein GUJ93_ZPchr0006g44128 [Zizania palustris]|uniref:Auxin-responsive protein n=1 Tax=Zizania palustris TaxID=103762 RepID=A0A8J5TFX4_ZIZPA|nr:hypothetical protein GUJ93_ZPchr0006g44128 [Zizania palustris]